MSKIFDALKKAGSSQERGFVDPILIEPVSNTAAVAIEAPTDTDAEIEPAIEEAAPRVPADQQHDEPRVAALHLSAISPVFPFEDLHSQAAEQYRIIRTKILHHPAKPRVIVTSSPTSGDGKTVTSINLAAVLALKQDVRVLLVDADLRRRDVHRVLGLPESPGLGEVLSGQCSLDEAVLRLAEFPNLSILTAGSASGNPAELLESPRWRDLVEELRQRYTYVIIDATPIAAVADFELIQLVCDGAILILRPDHTDRKACNKALETVAKDKLMGTILNCVDEWFLWKPQRYGYYYGSKV